MTAWLAVVSADHVRGAVERGFAQVGHGRRAPLARMQVGDAFVYYSPRETIDGSALQAFTAIALLPDNDIWQADEGSFQPFRRRADYAPDARSVSVRTLASQLELTSTPNWGYQLRRGLVPLSEGDFTIIHSAMTGTA